MPDHREFLKSFLQEERLLRAFLFAATGSPSVTDDLLQTVTTTLWEKWDQFDDSRPFRPWVLGFARIEVLRWRQQLARSREVLSEEAVARLAEVAVDRSRELDLRYVFLLDCLNAVKGASRNLLEMKYAEGLTAAQISDRLGKSVEAVEMSLVRLRRSLRECIERKAAKSGGDF